MLLDDIGDYLTSGGAALVGTKFYLGLLPEAPDIAGAVYETGGLGPVHAMGPGPGGAVVEMPRIQVVFRATKDDYQVARTAAHAAFKLLDGLPKRLINGVQYHWGAAVQSPFLMSRDVQGRVVIACNYDIVKEVSP